MFLDKVDAATIEGLSEDSRSYLKTIAKRASCSIQTVSNRLDQLHRGLGLKHTLEIRLATTGFPLQFFTRIVLQKDSGFDSRTFARTIAGNPFIQFAAITKGDFDLFLWCVARSNEEYLKEVEWPLRMQYAKFFDEWIAHPVLENRAGFIPVDDSLVNLMQIPGRRKALLSLLNLNSRMALTDIAKKLMVTEPTAEYHLKRLKPFVKRFTSFFEGSGEFMHLVRFIQTRGGPEEFQAQGRRVSKMYTSSDPRLFNRLVHASAISGGMDILFIENFTSLEDNEAYTEQLKSFSQVIGRNSSALLSRILKGHIPIRKVDYTKECKYLLNPAETET